MSSQSTAGGVTAYPLSWPANRKQTATSSRQQSRFDVLSFASARDELLREIKRLNSRSAVLSTNIELRNDGIPYANRRQPDDPGVAVYFVDKKGIRKCFACDRWKKIEDSMHAIRKTIEALRGIERWGSGEDMEAAFSGFTALPPASSIPQPWHVVLGCSANADSEFIISRWRLLSQSAHPDRGGSEAEQSRINVAFDQAKKERGIA